MSRSDEIHYAVESLHQIHVHECICGFSSPVSRDRTKHIVAAVLAETEPRTITTAEELDSLPVGSVVLSEKYIHHATGMGISFQRWDDWLWHRGGRSSDTHPSNFLPATVLWEPR